MDDPPTGPSRAKLQANELELISRLEREIAELRREGSPKYAKKADELTEIIAAIRSAIA